jgi:hypothetical protein
VGSAPQSGARLAARFDTQVSLRGAAPQQGTLCTLCTLCTHWKGGCGAHPLTLRTPTHTPHAYSRSAREQWRRAPLPKRHAVHAEAHSGTQCTQRHTVAHSGTQCTQRHTVAHNARSGRWRDRARKQWRQWRYAPLQHLRLGSSGSGAPRAAPSYHPSLVSFRVEACG